MEENTGFYKEFKANREKMNDYLLTNEDYEKLYFSAVLSGNEIAMLLLRVFKETGIRYGSLKDFTVEAINQGTVKSLIKRKIRI